MDFWNNFDLLEKIFIFIAAPASILLLIQLVLQLIGIGGEQASGDVASADSSVEGIDSDSGTDAESSGEDGSIEGVRSLRIFTYQGLVAFFAIAGWTGLLFAGTFKSALLAIFLAAVCGIAAMVILAYIMRLMLGLQSDGTVNIRNALGLQGVVYLRIPAANTGRGQVSVLIQERYREYDAVTYSKEMLPSGSAVRVVDIISDSVLVVEKID